MTESKYDKDHKANHGFTADKAKVDALYAKTAEIHKSKGRDAESAARQSAGGRKKADQE